MELLPFRQFSLKHGLLVVFKAKVCINQLYVLERVKIFWEDEVIKLSQEQLFVGGQQMFLLKQNPVKIHTNIKYFILNFIK